MSTHLGIATGTLLLLAASTASADGERTPMFGVAGVWTDSVQSSDQLAGVAVDLAWWHGRFGVAAEGSERWSIDHDGARATVVGGSLRLRVFDTLMPALVEPRDVELGFELQGIVERAWWNVATPGLEPTSYGLGLAVRLRGGGDPDGSMLLAESRFFVRVMTSRGTDVETIARTTAPAAATAGTTSVVLGIGGSWGAGHLDYADRFRRHPFAPTLLP